MDLLVGSFFLSFFLFFNLLVLVGEDFIKGRHSVPLIFRLAMENDVKPRGEKKTRALWLHPGKHSFSTCVCVCVLCFILRSRINQLHW